MPRSELTAELRALKTQLEGILERLGAEDMAGATAGEARARELVARLEARPSGTWQGLSRGEADLLRTVSADYACLLTALRAAREETATRMELAKQERRSLAGYRRMTDPYRRRSAGQPSSLDQLG